MCLRSQPCGKIFAAALLLAGLTDAVLGQETAAGENLSSMVETSAALPRISGGSVTLPYGELRALWEAAQPKPVLPSSAKAAAPVAYSVQSARYEITPGADLRQVTGQATFEVLNLAEGWTSIPLLPAGEMRLTSVEPEGTLLTVRDGCYALLLDAPSRRTVTLRFSADLPEGRMPQTRFLRLSGPAALVNELKVAGIPEGWLAEAPGATRDALPAAGTKDNASSFHLAAGQPLLLNLLSEQASKPVLPAPPAPSVWQVEAQSLVRYEEGQLSYKTRLRASADAGAGLTMELALPAAAGILSVEGADLERWRAVKSDAGDVRRIELTWTTPDVLRRELLLRYEISQTAPEGDWRLVSPQVVSAGGRLQSALYALPAVEGTEFALSENGAALPAAELRQLPGWMGKEAGGGNFVVLSAAQAAPVENAVSALRARRLPLLRTAQATIDESRFRTRLVTDGALLSEGELSVRHDGPLMLSLALPEGAQLLTCAVDGRNALPVDRGSGRIDLALPAGAANKPNQVRLSYTSHEKPMAPVSGQVALSLPQTDLFVQTLSWDLQIPDAYELTALEGNVEVAAAAASTTSAAPPGIHLRKELLKSERPTAELFYQKRAVAP